MQLFSNILAFLASLHTSSAATNRCCQSRGNNQLASLMGFSLVSVIYIVRRLYHNLSDKPGKLILLHAKTLPQPITNTKKSASIIRPNGGFMYTNMLFVRLLKQCVDWIMQNQCCSCPFMTCKGSAIIFLHKFHKFSSCGIVLDIVCLRASKKEETFQTTNWRKTQTIT